MMFCAVMQVIVARVSYLLSPFARHLYISSCASPSPNVPRTVVFGWLVVGIRVRTWEVINDRLVNSSLHTPLSILVILHFTVGEVSHCCIDEHTLPVLVKSILHHVQRSHLE